ncbi:lipoprotein [Spirochaetia bacterium]|nr:lipoprotein [Spirochaetia bacterium]
MGTIGFGMGIFPRTSAPQSIALKWAECFRLCGILAAILLVLSCSNRGETAVLWTDRSEFAIYAEYFNSSQNLHKVEVRYFKSPAEKLTKTGEFPDIITGSWLKSVSTRAFFTPLDTFFSKNVISRRDFYPRILALGRIDNKQYLLPVAFNIPALVFSRETGALISNPFIIGFEEIKTLGKEHNAETGGTYSRMGFSPVWDDEFLFTAASLFDADFREANPLAWDAAALERAMVYIQSWVNDANTGIQQVEDFSFKYFFEPPVKLVSSGRILFTYMDSSQLFTLAEERRSNLDFRWITEKNTIPLSEDAVFYGICRKGKAKKAAAAFTRWFFQPETQRLLLEMSRNMRMNETSFGISGGFSAIRGVTEQIFPRFYPNLLGHMPPEEFLSPPNVLPRNWITLKERIILPYLRERIRSANKDDISPLERRISDWSRLNRD